MSCRKHWEMHYFLSANRKEQKSVIHKIRFINSVIFMASPLSSLTDHLAKCLCKVNCKGCKWSLEYMNKEWFTNIQLFGQEHNRKILMKVYPKDFKIYTNFLMETWTNNKFFLMSWKGVYPYPYTWMVGRDSVKHHYPQKRNFTTIRHWRASQILTSESVGRVGRLWITKPRPVLWSSVCAKWYLIAYRHIWEF